MKLCPIHAAHLDDKGKCPDCDKKEQQREKAWKEIEKAIAQEKLQALRDKIAMAALTGLLAAESEDYNYRSNHADAAAEAYRLADAMLAARLKMPLA